jgi:integrase/recombinase XerD
MQHALAPVKDDSAGDSNIEALAASKASTAGKKGPPAALLDVATTTRTISKAVNGRQRPQISAIDYLKSLHAQHCGSESYRDGQRLAIDRLEEALAKRRRSTIEIWEVTADDIGQFKVSLLAAGLSGNTIRYSLSALGALFQTAVDRKALRRNVVRLIQMPPRPQNSPRRPFTDEELKRVCAIADPEWFGMIMVAIYTGLRLGDICRLVFRDLDLATHFIRASVKKTRDFQPKPVPPPLAFYFQRMRFPENPDQPLFPRAYRLVMAGQRSIVSQSFVDMLVKVGLRAPKAKVRGVRREGAEKYMPLSFHCLRHNYTTMLKRANIPEAIARRIAGHLSIAISDVYTHLGEDVMRAAVANLPEIEGVSTYY